MTYQKLKFKPKNEWEAVGDTLMFAMGFTPQDLAANQEGQLSQEQRGLLTTRQGYWMAAAVISVLILLWSVANAGWRFDVAIGRGNIAWLIAAAVAVLSVYLWKQNRDDLIAPQIGAVQGRVELDIASSSKSSTFTLKVGDLKFNVGKEVFLAFKNGDPYVIYYTLYTKRLLSAEWLREE